MPETAKLTGAQFRAARALLNISVAELAERTGLAINTIRKAEGTNATPKISESSRALLTLEFERSGIKFVQADEFGPGVRFSSKEPSVLAKKRRS